MRRKKLCVLLVQVASSEEGELGLSELPVRVLRVRHPVPACVRIRVVRPHIVAVGPAVGTTYLFDLLRVTREVGASIVAVGPDGREKLHARIAVDLQSGFADAGA